MKKLISIFLALFVMFSLSLPVFADILPEEEEEYPLFTEQENLIGAADEAAILKNLQTLSEYHGFTIAARTIEKKFGKSEQQYADDFYDNHYEGDGVLFLLDMGERQMYISTYGKGIEAFTDYGIQEVLNQIAPYMQAGDYAGGLNEFATQADRLITLYEQGTPLDVKKETENSSFDYMTALAISLIIGLLIGFIIVNTQKRALKTVNRKYQAAEYRNEESFFLTDSRDIYLYQTVNRIPKPKMNSDDFGGMGGSSVHMSGGGMMHGGGGRGF